MINEYSIQNKVVKSETPDRIDLLSGVHIII